MHTGGGQRTLGETSQRNTKRERMRIINAHCIHATCPFASSMAKRRIQRKSSQPIRSRHLTMCISFVVPRDEKGGDSPVVFFLTDEIRFQFD